MARCETCGNGYCNTMKGRFLFLGLVGLLWLNWTSAHADFITTNSVSTNCVIIIDQSSASVGIIGKATLTIGALKREGDVFSGNYQVKVSPYSFKNEKGHLAIVVSEDAMREVAKGKAVDVSGTATTTGSGKTRQVEAVVTPTNSVRGTLKLWFTAGKRKMIFESAYRFAEK